MLTFDRQMSEKCKMLAIKHYMLKPVQRIPQYKLLLEKYLRHVPKDSEEYSDAQTALSIVSKVADHINQSIKDVVSLRFSYIHLSCVM